MSTYSFGFPCLRTIATLLVLAGMAPLARANFIVNEGWTLYQTDPGTTSFLGAPFEGVPLYTFDFGAGPQDVGGTDTIVRRLDSATASGPGGSATVATRVDAFQLKSVGPVSLMGGPLGVYFITLQSTRGGPDSTGTLTLNFGPEGDPHGTFSSSFSLYVDVRLGSFSGPILDSRLIEIPDSGANAWSHESPEGIKIFGVNFMLNEVDTSQDFWFQGMVFKETPNGGIGAGNAMPVPDTGSNLWLLALSGLGITLFRRVTHSTT